jgi:hypothetical protein
MLVELSVVEQRYRPSRGAVRADLPQQRHPPAAYQALLAHHGQGGALAPDPARANAAKLVPEPDLLVQPEWIDEDDLSASR